MQLNKNTSQLICELEYLLGKQTYNPKSYNGWTGEEGKEYKYPVNYCKSKKDLKAHELTKTKYEIETIAPECIGTMKYIFGSNHLYVGDGLVEILNYLEKVYDLNFNDLENKRTKKRRKALTYTESALDKNDIVEFKSGKYIVGLDLPIGEVVIDNAQNNNYYSIINIYDNAGEYIDHIFLSKDDKRKYSFSRGNIIVTSTGFSLKR